MISSSSTMRPCGGVDQEHAARLQPALLHDARRVDVEHADLARHDHEVVVGHPVAARAQAVAVEHRADHGAVGERDRRRAVPRLHQRRVELVEGALLRRHRRVVLPRLRDHHQHRVRQIERPPRCSSSSTSSKRRGVGRARACRSGRRARGRRDERSLAQQRLAGAHPVAVALHRVDLAVVGDVAVRVRERPRRERVRREAAVHQRERRLDPLVVEVGEELGELRRGEHALVDERAARQRSGSTRRLWPTVRSRARSACATTNSLPVERRCRRAPSRSPTKSCRKLGIDARARSAPIIESSIGHVAPAEDPQALARRRSSRSRGRPPCRRRRVARAGSAMPTRVAPAGGRSKSTTARRNRSGIWIEDAGAVAGVRPRRPDAPRWSRLQSAPSAVRDDVVGGAALACRRRTTTPQASCSKAGS